MSLKSLATRLILCAEFHRPAAIHIDVCSSVERRRMDDSDMHQSSFRSISSNSSTQMLLNRTNAEHHPLLDESFDIVDDEESLYTVHSDEEQADISKIGRLSLWGRFKKLFSKQNATKHDLASSSAGLIDKINDLNSDHLELSLEESQPLLESHSDDRTSCRRKQSFFEEDEEEDNMSILSGLSKNVIYDRDFVDYGLDIVHLGGIASLFNPNDSLECVDTLDGTYGVFRTIP